MAPMSGVAPKLTFARRSQKRQKSTFAVDHVRSTFGTARSRCRGWGHVMVTQLTKATITSVVALALFVLGANPAAAGIDQGTKDYLEGVWMVGTVPSAPNCIDAPERAKLVEFEFGRTGGRYMEIETPIFFVTSTITDITRNGDDVTITTPPSRLTFHIVSADRIEGRSPLPYGVDPTSELDLKTYTFTRCGLPKHQVNLSATVDRLRVLTPTGTNDVRFLEAKEDATDEQACKNAFGGFRHWLMFDVFGPVHFYVQGEVGDREWNKKLDTSPIRSVVTPDRKTFKLEILERAAGPDLWNWGKASHPFVLTLIWDGKRMAVPEMGKTFVRCRISDFGKPNSEVPAPLP